MRTIEIPDGGCSVYYGSYLDHYVNGTRTRYYLNEDHLVSSTTSTYSRLPDGAVCLTQGELRYNPESEVYFSVISIAVFILVVLFSLRMLVIPFWRRLR